VSPDKVLHKLEVALDLKALPFAAAEIIRVTGDPRAGARELTEAIETDHALTAKVLRLASSVVYAQAGRVRNLTQVVTKLGFGTIREMALAVSIIEHYRKKEGERGLDRLEFWRHTLGCGALARELAALVPGAAGRIEEAFLAGLLHDIGRAVLDDNFHDAYGAVLEAAKAGTGHLHEVEREAFGMDHAAVSSLVAEKWKLPEALRGPIVTHHLRWDKVCLEAKGDLLLYATVRLANALTKAACVGSGGDDTLEDVPPALVARLRIDPARILEAAGRLEHHISELTQILLLHDGKLVPSAVPAGGRERLVLVVRDQPAALDPLDVLLARLGFRFRAVAPQDTASALAAEPADLAIACASFAPAVQAVAGFPESLAREIPHWRIRLLVLEDAPVPEALRARISQSGGTILPAPFRIPRLAEILNQGT
jgi:HD-like signal output (HDOD) protein